MPKKQNRPAIGITMGDPAGIGAEVIAKSLARPAVRRLGPFVIIGDLNIFRRYCPRMWKDVDFVDVGQAAGKEIKVGKSSRASARAALSYLQTAVALLKTKHIAALVTAPICKEAVSALGQHFHGHTEFLAKAFAVPNYDMMFVANGMRSICVTRHIPLNRVSRALTAKKIYHTIALTNTILKQKFKIRHPRLAVCGVNPHAGEGGDIGKEEITKIIPALQKAQRNRISVQGPFAADTLFSPDIKHPYDAVIAMYHDQGLIPVKTLHFTRVVNLTIGLPFVRTSPAHGTAFAIAGKGQANPASMGEAIKLAARLSRL